MEDDIKGFLNRFAHNGLVIDEAQNIPELFSYLQIFVDISGEMVKIVLSGSQNFLLMKKISQTLAGRVGLVNLFPFSLKELKTSNYWKDDVYDFIFQGFYPALYDRNIAPGDYYPGLAVSLLRIRSKEALYLSRFLVYSGCKSIQRKHAYVLSWKDLDTLKQ